ncbi:hypothetical protein GCM10011360_18540 [Primorskyibacter flagellatus]|uniref:Uncharacterized protein n=1 Tax=Primorskyibacter flagellatus TaxID=1387277 RepID=A0A917EEV8_9RHOB|nr:hypothetical protein [Primorskyibacter flagellatus]GGE30810.1 hypothetical protein GCM10011360_18540 [Primorskyibacter flagellatus]
MDRNWMVLMVLTLAAGVLAATLLPAPMRHATRPAETAPGVPEDAERIRRALGAAVFSAGETPDHRPGDPRAIAADRPPARSEEPGGPLRLEPVPVK